MPRRWARPGATGPTTPKQITGAWSECRPTMVDMPSARTISAEDRADAADRGPQIEADRSDGGDGPSRRWQSGPSVLRFGELGHELRTSDWESTRVNARRPVSRVLSPPCGGGWPFIWDARCRAPRATDPDGDAETRPASPCGQACHPYLVLLPVGFALPPPLPEARCALTAPFHPCRPARRLRVGGMFLWHFPWGRPRRALPGTVFPWSPDFPRPALRRKAAIRPSGGAI